MSYWNYRVFKEKIGKEVQYSIREAYYDDKQTTPNGWTKDAIPAVGESLKELKRDLDWMLKALEHQVIDLDKKKGRK